MLETDQDRFIGAPEEIVGNLGFQVVVYDARVDHRPGIVESPHDVAPTPTIIVRCPIGRAATLSLDAIAQVLAMSHAEHTDEILAGLGKTPEEIKRLRDNGTV